MIKKASSLMKRVMAHEAKENKDEGKESKKDIKMEAGIVKGESHKAKKNVKKMLIKSKTY